MPAVLKVALNVWVPASASVWEEIYRATVGQLDTGAVMEPALKYTKIARKTPRHNH